MKKISQEYYNTYQIKMPLEISRIIEISDPVYTYNEVLNHIDLKKYLAKEGNRRTGRPGYDTEKLLRIVLFAFMDTDMNPYGRSRSCVKRIYVSCGCWTEVRLPVS